MNDFQHKYKLRIDWGDLDLFGHVNHLSILRYIQSARVSLLEKLDLMQMQAREKKGPILASMNSQFRKPLFYPGEITVLSKIVWIKNTSFCVQHKILDQDNETALEVQDIIVFYDFIKNSKLKLPAEIRERMESLECLA